MILLLKLINFEFNSIFGLLLITTSLNLNRPSINCFLNSLKVVVMLLCLLFNKLFLTFSYFNLFSIKSMIISSGLLLLLILLILIISSYFFNPNLQNSCL